VSRAILRTDHLALLVALFFAVHPANFVAVLWLCQIGLLAHLLFQVWAIRKVLQDEVVASWPLMTLLLVQQLTFGNGHFVPLAVAYALLFLRERRSDVTRLATLLFLVSVAFVLGQYLLLLSAGSAPDALHWHEGLAYPRRLAGFVLTNVARAALLFDRVIGHCLAQTGALASGFSQPP
jgi:hypothetical protein